MFDVGFWELFLIGLILLLVLGPERLPTAAKTIGRYLRKARLFSQKISSEIEAELAADEIKQQLSFDDKNDPTVNILNESKKELNRIKKSVEKR